MRAIIILSKMTFLESVREKLFLVFFIFGVLSFGLSFALGHLSFAEQERIAASFGLSASHLVSCVVAIFLAVSLYFKEFERKTVHLLLSKPIHRIEFLFGKFLGYAFVQGSFVIGLGLLLALQLLLSGIELNFLFLLAIFFIFLEGLILISVGMFFSGWSRPVVAAFLTASFFLIGHWLESLSFFVQKNESEVFKFIGSSITKIWPNLDHLNFRDNFILEQSVGSLDLLAISLYSFLIVSAFLGFTHLILSRKDLV